MKDIIAIVGPTASGKTGLSIALAKHLQTEIICMDSMQIYQRMNIGTAKPTLEEMDGIPHHMLDVVPPDVPYSVAQYKADAEKCIEAVHGRGKIPILVGGTGLYLKALCTDMHMGHTVGSVDIRAKYEAIAEKKGADHVHALLLSIDPKAAARLHPNNVRRVIRALEVYEATGVPLGESPPSPPQSHYRFTIIGIACERSRLIKRINLRVDQMLSQGLAGEVDTLIQIGVPADAQAMQGIGYKELVPYLKGETTLEAAIELIKVRTRQYAKRQMTWFRRTPEVHWVNLDDGLLFEQAKDVIPSLNGGRYVSN